MINTKYKMVGKFMQGVDIIGFQLQNNAVGELKQFSIQDTKRLISMNLVENSIIVKDKDSEHILCEGFSISEIPTITNNKIALDVIARVFGSEGLVGYIAVDASGAKYTLSTSKAWQLARTNNISNVKASYCNGKKILRGVGIELRDLPKLKDK